MAKKQDRLFSESDALKGEKFDAYSPEAEERLPSWAVHDLPEQQEETFPEEKEEKPAFTLPPLNRPEDGEAVISQSPAKKEEAESAWEREATRVESTQARRFQSMAENGNSLEKPAKKKKSPDEKGKKPPKKRSNKKKKKKKGQTDEDRRNFLKSMVIILICAVLFLGVALMVLSSFISHPLLALPRQMVTSIITPVQNAFSGLTDDIVGYLRMLKIRGNLEYEYEQLTILLDEYATQVAENEELRRINEELHALLDEQERNRNMMPVAATVIGTDSSNYFSTLTLDVGLNSGVKDYMAVVAQGGLVGVTYNTEADKCQVRCIISSDCTVAALIQSSRDQGSVKGTLGINGEPMCRMYYLPDNSLPRPGDVVVTSGVGLEFPKGIPIGYIRESTRGMEENKSYVVLEPVVDFQHLEYVTVYRYTPAYTEDAQARVSTDIELVGLSTPRPVPTFAIGSVSDFIFAPTATPDGMTPAPTAPGETPAPEATALPPSLSTPDPHATTPPPNLEYNAPTDPNVTPTPTPRPTATPVPTPEPTQDPGGLTVEEEE